MIRYNADNTAARQGIDGWNDFVLNLGADFADLKTHFHIGDLFIPLCALGVTVSQDGISIAGEKIPISDFDKLGRQFLDSVKRQQAVFLNYVHLSGNRPSLEILTSPDIHDCPVILGRFDGRRSDEALVAAGMNVAMRSVVLPDSVSDKICDIGLLYAELLRDAYSQRFKNRLSNLYHNLRFDRKDELVFKLSYHLVCDDKPLDMASVYNLMVFFDESDLRNIRDRVCVSVREFYHEMYEQGEFKSKDEAERCISFAEDRMDGYVSKDTQMLGRLGYQVANLGDLKGLVSPEDIARVALWAERLPSYAPYVGKPLEGWVSSTCRYYHVKVSEVNNLRVELGGHVMKEPSRPKVSRDIVKKAKLKFGNKMMP